jgi:hypothetical protein
MSLEKPENITGLDLFGEKSTVAWPLMSTPKNSSVNRGGRRLGTEKERTVINAAIAIGMNPHSGERHKDVEWGAKCLVSASLPLRAPKPEHLQNGCWIRKNGNQTLWIQGGPQGIPYGAYPRLFMIWLTSEAIRKGNRRIETGGNFTEFFRKLNVDTSRGRNGAGRRLIEQIGLLLQSRAALIEGDMQTGKFSGDLLQFTDKFSLLFDPQLPSSDNFFESEILLTQKFFDEITTRSIPLDGRAVAAVRQSALQLDIYQWLAYRMFGLRAPSFPTWRQLYQQFGSQTARLVDFRIAFLSALHVVQQVYPQAKVTPTESGLALYPSRTPIAPKKCA